MKILLIFSVLVSIKIFSQEIQKLDHCKCVDKIDKTTPTLEGKYERTCKDKIIETGSFVNGQKNGEWITYTKEGKIIRKINYTEGKLSGDIQLFYFSGKPKLTASFIENKKNGIWIYYTEDGKEYINGEYLLDKPINNWIIKDLKGSKVLVEYNYTTSQYIKNKPLEYHKNLDIIQNDNTGWYSILLYPDRIEKAGTAPLGGYFFAGELLVELLEVPVDFWNTYASINYNIDYNILTDNSYTFSITRIEDHLDDEKPIYPYLIKTDDAKKLKKVEHSELSKTMLDFKIKEALSFMPPWIYSKETQIEVYLPYVVNQIENIDEVFK